MKGVVHDWQVAIETSSKCVEAAASILEVTVTSRLQMQHKLIPINSITYTVGLFLKSFFQRAVPI